MSAILFRAMVPLSGTPPPNLSGTRVLICSGTHDPIVPVSNVQELEGILRSAGADVTLRLEEASHQLVFAEIAAAKKWLAQSSPA
jgi:predicted esterase